VLQVRGAASVGGDGQREEHDTRDEKFAGIKRGELGGDAGNDADEKFIFTPPTETQRARDTCFRSPVIGGESNLL
jgi:hypothetical protein